MTTLPVPIKKSTASEQALFAALLGIVLFFVFAAALLAAFQIHYAGKIFPGVRVAGFDLSGLSPQDAAARLADSFAYPQKGRVFFQDGEQVWQAAPADLGLYLDPQSSVTQAFAVGRSADLFSNLSAQLRTAQNPVNLPPVLVYDQRRAVQYLNSIASLVNKPVIDASVSLSGVEVTVRSGQVGRTLDLPATLSRLGEQMLSLQDALVPLAITETPPIILDATAQANLARQILSAPLVLKMPDGQSDKHGPWTFDVKTLASMLSLERTTPPDGAPTYAVAIDSSKLKSFLTDLAPSMLRASQNARFTFNDTTHQLEVLQPAVIGRELDIDATLKAIQQDVAKGEHTVTLALKVTPPQAADNTTGEQLGIRELVHQEVSYFYGSSAARIQNIKAASSKFHGLLIPPGGTLSMSDVIGDISLDNGFAEALIIYNGRTVTGVGGGVCQVSTTLFRAAFFAGYPIVERHAHAYRVSYYEKVAGNRIDSRLAGLDATVFVPLVDFKFKNDTSSWLLMETYVNPNTSTLTWKFYSTNDGRKVAWDTTGPTNTVKPPDPVYRENSSLAKGVIKRIDYAVEGADISVTRTVTRDGKTLYRDVISTHYVPWPDQYEYGPGTELPTPTPDGG